MNLLYLTWDSPSSTYLESLFFPIFGALRTHGIRTHVLYLSWDLDSLRARAEASAAHHQVGLELHAIPRRPLQAASAAAVALGALHLARAVRRSHIDIVMPRSHIPAAIALVARPMVPRVKLVWDSDGLMPDERVDFGWWPRDGLNYRVLRRVESAMIRSASTTITRTTGAAKILAERTGRQEDQFQVVPNGKDSATFSPGTAADRLEARRQLNVHPDVPLFTHVGSIGPQYHLPRALEVLKRVRVELPTARMLILTGALDEAREIVERSGLPPGVVIVQRAEPDAVGALLRACDGGFAFREPTLSQLAVCPIKVAEYLLSGVPVIGNRGVGDVERHLEGTDAGLLATTLDDDSLAGLARRFVDDVWPNREVRREACRAVGLQWYSLHLCAAGYARAVAM